MEYGTYLRFLDPPCWVRGENQDSVLHCFQRLKRGGSLDFRCLFLFLVAFLFYPLLSCWVVSPVSLGAIVSWDDEQDHPQGLSFTTKSWLWVLSCILVAKGFNHAAALAFLETAFVERSGYSVSTCFSFFLWYR